jgi:hypothetical protein
MFLLTQKMSRCSAAGIATGYGLDDRGVGVQVPVGKKFSLLHIVQTSSGVHPTSYPKGTGYIHSPICLHGVMLN